MTEPFPIRAHALIQNYTKYHFTEIYKIFYMYILSSFHQLDDVYHTKEEVNTSENLNNKNHSSLDQVE